MNHSDIESAGSADGEEFFNGDNQPPTSRRRAPTAIVVIAVVGLLAFAIGAGIIVSKLRAPSLLAHVYETCDGPQAAKFVLANSTELSEEDHDHLEESGDYEHFAEFLDDRLELEDSDTTLLVTTLPEEDDILGVSTTAISCVLLEMEAPAWVENDIFSTRALDGTRDAKWESFHFQWRYHPDNGMRLVVREVDS